jgi:hypothetical protein
VKKSKGQRLAEAGGYYAVLKDYGMETGLQKLRAYWEHNGVSEQVVAVAESYLLELSWNEIKQKATMFAIGDRLAKFLGKGDATLF